VAPSYDTVPSILNRQLPQDSSEPDIKRAKSEDGKADVSSINARASSNAYMSLEDVVSDIKSTTTSLLADLKLPTGSSRNQYMPITPREVELASRILIFKKKAEELLQQEELRQEMKSMDLPEKINSAAFLLNGALTNSPAKVSAKPGDNKLVLTLYGNAPGAKQLFSGLQDSVRGPDGVISVPKPLREAGLPNGISTTQIVPIADTGFGEEKKRVQTLGELFSSSTGSLPFQPPKPSRVVPSKGSAVGWHQPTPLESIRSRSNQSYFNQTISAGQWLEYTGTSTSSDPKRKQRERALSLNGIKAQISDVESADQEAAKLDALFRSAYSGFAPTKDNAAAVIPEGVVNRMWWQKHGELTFEKLARIVDNTKMLDNLEPAEPMDLANGEPKHDEDDEFREAVENWEESIDPSLEQETDKPIVDKDVQEVLDGISDLLETLNSYQRNRNLALSAIPRSVGVLGGADSSPAKPTEAETATYNMLKSQLALMIATLPPYAVAKLNSDQLSELNVSTKIPILMDSYKGVLEEDEYAARAKVAAMSTAASSRTASTTAHHRASSSSLYGNQYSSSPRPSASSGQYYAQAQTPNRAPISGMHRAPQTAPVPFSAPRPSVSAGYRPQPAYSTPNYPHQQARPVQQQYAPTSQGFYSPSAPKYSNMGGSQFGGVPQTAPQGVRYQQPANTYQQTPQAGQNGMNYRYGNTANLPRQPSPQKPPPLPYNSQFPNPQTAPRPFATPSSGMSQDARYYGQAHNGTASMSPQPLVPQSVPQQPQMPTTQFGATGYHTVMSAAEQANMMERQRAQLAQQQGIQHQARNAAQAGALNGSPNKQPATMNGAPVSAGP
jgi:hypothetical protein